MVKGQGKAISNQEGNDMGITDMIAGFIQEALDDAGGVLEMQRGDLAQRFGCVPSQINYVMSTLY